MENISSELMEKYNKLKDIISGYKSVAVAFSSGVDSAFLLYAAKDTLGEGVVAVTATSFFFPARELEEAKEFCCKLGIKHILAEIDENDIEHFTENPKNRCYYCKTHLFTKLKSIAMDEGMNEIIEGSNVDDLGDYRPGLQALKELDIKSPLREAGLTKADIRALSKHFDLPSWKKPSFACLASRIPYGEKITRQKLSMIEKAENYLLGLGFEQFRVRIHGGEGINSGYIARIELLPGEFPKMLDENLRDTLYQKFREIGFAYTALDLKGYRTGSMNETFL